MPTSLLATATTTPKENFSFGLSDTEASTFEEPGAKKRHAGIRAGAVWATGRPTAMTGLKDRLMRVRAIRDLSQLSDAEFFVSVAEGLSLVLNNAVKLHDGAALIAQTKRSNACRVLDAVAEEEAAKFLALTDAVRCPRQPGERFARQLGRFSDHLAKVLYSDACG